MILFLHEFQSREQTFWKKFRDTLCSIGDVSSRKRPLRYPQNVSRYDLRMVGGDMCKAMGIAVKEIEAKDDGSLPTQPVG